MIGTPSAIFLRNRSKIDALLSAAIVVSFAIKNHRDKSRCWKGTGYAGFASPSAGGGYTIALHLSTIKNL
jgi:hypothetical protein